MGDVSYEPSMEDILSSIKRIIAEEGESAVATRTRRPARAVPPPPVVDEDEILELSEPVPAESRQPEAPAPAPEPVQFEAPAEPILSATTAQATRGPLEALSRMIVKPEVAGSDTLEGMVRELLRPMLREWLDANLPPLVEAIVAKEISRITGRRL